MSSSGTTDDVRYGDLVASSFDDDDGNSHVMIGRAVGKFLSRSIEQEHYLVTLVIDDTWRTEGPGWLMTSLVGAIGRRFDPLEWGLWPAADRPCIVLAGDEFRHALGGSSGAKAMRRFGVCPRCGHSGEWRSLALCCPWHGMYI